MGKSQTRPAFFSPTALRSHDTCRRQYAWTYLERRRTEDDPTPALVFGNALHQAMALLYRLPPTDRCEASAHQALRHCWTRTTGRAEAFLSDEEEASWGQSALQALSRYCRGFAEELAGAPLALEHRLKARLGNGLIVGGRIDRLEYDQQGQGLGLVVIDYKTGSCPYDEDGDLAEDRGAQVYAWAARQYFGQPVTEVRFHYLRDGQRLRWMVETEDLELIEKRLMSTTREILLADAYPPRPGSHCDWCGHRHACDAGAGPATLRQLQAPTTTVF